MKQRNKKWWRKPVVVVPLGMVVLGLIGVVGFRVAAKRGLEWEMEAIRERGLPMNPVELDRWYAAVPKKENFALKILAACERYVEPSSRLDPLKYSLRDTPDGEALSAEVAEAARDYVEKNREVLEEIHQSAGLKRSRYPVDLSDSKASKVDHLGKVKSLMILLKWEAMTKADRGDAAGAARSLMSGFAVVGSLKEEPLLIAGQLRTAWLGIHHLEALEWTVNRVQFDEDTLKEFERAAEQAEVDGKRSMQRVIGGQFAYVGKDVFSEISLSVFGYGLGASGYENVPELAERLLFVARRGAGIESADAAFYLRSLRELEKAAELENPAMLQETKAAFAGISAKLKAHPIKYMVSEMMLPSLDKMVQKETLLASRLRCVRAGLAIERFRLRNAGRLPQMEELVPEYLEEWPTDAVDGTPLKLEFGGKYRYRVAAVGASELANEGRARTSANWQDVAFTVVR